jgi:hypothetical protein
MTHRCLKLDSARKSEIRDAQGKKRATSQELAPEDDNRVLAKDSPASDGVLDAEVQHRISAIAPMPAKHALYLNLLVI